jgi:glycosyltransferase involved in cell wall biosynthesis
MRVLIANFAFDPKLADPDQLLDTYATLTGWSDALVAAGASRVAVLQAFHRRGLVRRGGVEYVFVKGTRWGRLPSENVDVAHVNGLEFPRRTRWLRARLARSSTLVIQDHASGPPPARRISRIIRRRAFNGVDGFLFTARQQADSWQSASIIRPEQTVFEVLESSTTMRPVSRDAARQTSGIRGDPALLWVGRLNANKDPLTVLDGFELAVASLPEARLTMVFGSTELLLDVQKRIAALPQLAERVRLVGAVPHERLDAYYSAADIFVLGSHHEGSGYALLEAVACGVAPVVTSIPAFRAITAGGQVGTLWQPGHARSFADALIRTAARHGPDLRAAMTRHFERTLSWSAIGRRAMEIYGEVCERRRRG